MTSPSPPSPASLRVRRLAGGAVLQLGGKLTGRGLGFLAHMLLARTLGTAAYGVFGIGWTLFQLAGLMASMGLEHGAVRYASRHLGRDPRSLAAVLRRALGLALGSGIAIGALLALAAPILSVRVFSMPELRPVLLGFSLGVALTAGLRVAAAGTRVSQRMRYSTLAEDLVLPATHLLLLVVLLGIGWRLAAGVVAPVVAYGVAFALAAYALRLLFPVSSRGAESRELSTARLLIFSGAAALSGILGLLTIWADRLLVGVYLSKAEAGVYVAASQISLLFAVVLSALNTVFAPMIAELHGKGEIAELESLFRISTKWGLYASCPLFLAILSFPGELLSLLGQGFSLGAIPMMILAAGQMANLATGAVGLILVMSGQQNRLLALSTLTLACNITLNVLWIPRYGLTGAALATAFSLTGLFSVALAAVRRTPGIWPYDRRLSKAAPAVLVAGSALVVLRLALPEPAAWHLAAVVAIAYGLFVTTLAVQGLDREDRTLLERLIGTGSGGGRTA